MIKCLARVDHTHIDRHAPSAHATIRRFILICPADVARSSSSSRMQHTTPFTFTFTETWFLCGSAIERDPSVNVRSPDPYPVDELIS